MDCTVYISCGLYYKNIMIVNDASRVIIEGCHNLEHHLWSSIMLLELSVMLLVNIYNTGFTNDNHHMMIAICLQHRPLVWLSLSTTFTDMVRKYQYFD
jgi:hypothetical protein